MKKIKIFLLLIVSSLLLSGCQNQTDFYTSPAFEDHQLIELKVGNKDNLYVEVVNTSHSMSQGLSGREEIGVDGMIFVYDQPVLPKFWMKEMKFNIDIVWINNNRVVDITYDVPAPKDGESLNELPTYSPNQGVEMVLEVLSGKADEWNLKVGDLVETR